MRAAVWCAALALLAVTSAYRTPQVEGASRVGRRQPGPALENRSENSDTPEVTTYGPRISRRRQEILGRDARTRSRSSESIAESPQPQQNERFDARRTRTRNRPVENETHSEAPTGRENVIRSRPRANYRRPTTQSPDPLSQKSYETKEAVVNSARSPQRTSTPKSDDPNQFKRRGTTASTTEGFTRRRGRINTRVDVKALDLAVSGTTNTITAVKEPTTARNTDEQRDARKLRYKTRLSETDTNLTGEGITTNEVTKSSQIKVNTTSQPEIQPTKPTIEPISTITEAAVLKSSIKSAKVVRRPLTRGKVNFRPSVSIPVKKQSDEISEDDNYPESFKALIQAKNASTQTSSPTSESLSVKASQKIYNTYTTSAQSTNTGSAKTKYTRYRSKITEENVKKNETQTEKTENTNNETTIAPEKPKLKTPEHRPRSTYNPRNRKINHTSSTETSSSSQSSERPVYKFNRKYKSSTTEAPKIESTSKFKRLGNNNHLKKSTVRPTYSRRNLTDGSSFFDKNKYENDSSDAVKIKSVLPKTSYYSRLRQKTNKNISTTAAESATEFVETPANKKSEDSADMPLIFSLLKKPSESDSTTYNKTEKDEEPEREKKMFIIAVSSKESLEKSSENEVTSRTEEEEKSKIDTAFSTQKYHANFKNNVVGRLAEANDQVVNEATPPIRNIQTRRNGRIRTRPEYPEEVSEVTPRPRERHFRKPAEGFTKSVEPSTNGIPPEPEKQKSRFSSKFRASYLDKPFYKPTVPTVTPSTAWLKFFVTDPQLAKSVDEPYWFEGDDIFVTTEMSRQTTVPPITHESSLELVEGEEIELGPDMNAISFTKTRSTLSSADLKLSESLTKASHVMNVEASQHSPSVTVSIFDALAEILTSTPRTPRLSSTTEVNKKQNINDIQALSGVSNSITVNNVKGLAQDTFMTITDVNFNSKFVQTTAPTTPTVINQLLVKESTPSLNTQDGTVSPVYTPTPTPLPTTPVSARRPFAFKVLYSDVESPKDISTATETTRSSTQPSTDITTVHNTVSDLLLTNNNLVSSELTSMLSNNIKDIIQNMDEETKSKISVDMAKLLKTLIPRALDIQMTLNDDVDIIPNTTPYSMEELKDTENIEIDDKNNVDNKIDISSPKTFQTVTTENVNSTMPTTTPSVNSDNSLSDLIGTQSMSVSQITSADAVLTTTERSVSGTTSRLTENLTTATSSAFTDTDSILVSSAENKASVSPVDNTNTNVPLPFFTNFKVYDFTPSEVEINTSTAQSVPIPLITKSIAPVESSKSNLPGPSQISPLQLWVLSRKAQVLQMIEDLIKQHNTEIATAPPLTELLSQPNNIPLSNRLTEILNTMTSTTETNDATTESSTIPMSTLSISPFPLITTQSSQTGSPGNSENGRTATFSTTDGSVNTFTTTGQTPTDIFSRLEITGFDISGRQTTTENTEAVTTTPPNIATMTNTPDQEVVITQGNTETTTDSFNSETTQTDADTTTLAYETTQIDTIKTNARSSNESKQSIVSVSNQIPKKDFVIFGILPNNTVVRKDPNEDILETLTEASPYIVYSLLPNNTVIRRFPNGTRVPRVMQKIDVLPISPWSLRNPYSPIHNNPAIVRPHNPIRVSTNIVTSTDTSNNGTRLTNDTVNNLQSMIPTTLNIKDRSSWGVTTATKMPPAEKSTASHVLSLRTTTMLPSVDEILLNSISSAVKEEMVISSMTSSTREPRILTLDMDPETKQIRTEKPGDGNEGTVFKYIPIDEVTVASLDSNVLKLASTRAPSTSSTGTSSSAATVTEVVTQTPQIQTRLQTENPTTTEQMTAGTPIAMSSDFFTNEPLPTESTTYIPMTTMPLTTNFWTTPEVTTTEATTPTMTTIITQNPATIPVQTTAFSLTTVPYTTVTSVDENPNFQEDVKILQKLLATERSPKSINEFSNNNKAALDTTLRLPATRVTTNAAQQNEEAKLLQALLTANSQSTISIPNFGGSRQSIGATTTTPRSIEDDIRQFEEDTKLLKALLAATGQNPANLNIPSLESLNLPSKTTTPITTTTPRPTTTTPLPTTTTVRIQTTTQSFKDDLKQLSEDAKLLQALLQATGKNTNNGNIPIISGITSNVRIASDPKTTSIVSNPTTPVTLRPVYTSRTTTPAAPAFTTVPTTLQPQEPSTPEDGGFPSTLPPNVRRRLPTTTVATGRRAPTNRFTVTTEIPSTSTFSDEEDLMFLKNLKTVLKNNPNDEDPEAALANRIIALAVERSLNEIESGKQADVGRTGKSFITTPTTRPTTTTTTTTTASYQTTTIKDNTPSIDDDIKQFQEDTKLLQALLKATGQDPSKFNIPTLPNVNTNSNVSPKLPSTANDDLTLLSNLLASPSPLNEPFDSLTEKSTTAAQTTPARPFGAKIVVKDDLKNEKDDAKLLKTLITLQGVQETTTQRSKLAITGQSSDEALKKLIQTKSPNMLSQATKAPVAISTEYGKSNDALLASLLKEQGFGPTTASSLDEQLRLAALLNQVVVTPKARRTTTPPPPPPPPPRRPILDGLAWLWQQWRETGPGPGGARPSRRPTSGPTQSSQTPAPPRLAFFGSGPFVGNADDQPTSNRIPLEPPGAVVAEQAPGRGQVISAAINVTRAFSQFLGAAIAGAAQTVQSVIRAGQRAATDAYSTGSG